MLEHICGAALGVSCGLGQLYIISRYVRKITGDSVGPSAMALGLGQVFLPFLLLILIAFLWRDALLGFGIGMGTALLMGGLALSFKNRKR
jgi:hypothetical protein